MSNPNSRVNVVWICGRGHEHPLCIELAHRGVPPELRCSPSAASGYSAGGGGCTMPDHLSDRVEALLRQDLERWKRLGHVEVRA